MTTSRRWIVGAAEWAAGKHGVVALSAFCVDHRRVVALVLLMGSLLACVAQAW